MKLLQTHLFFAKLSKFSFATSKVSYLGHIISQAGVAPDPEKIKAITEWPQPRSLMTLRAFLGLTGFYRKFIRDYATLAAPLTDLLHCQKFTWPNTAQLAFTTVKAEIAKVPNLHFPNFTQPFVVDTDAFAVVVGAVLSQASHPIAFLQQKDVSPSPSSISVCERDVCNHRSNKKMASILVREPFHNIHRSKEPQYTAITDNSDTRTTKMDSKTLRV